MIKGDQKHLSTTSRKIEVDRGCRDSRGIMVSIQAWRHVTWKKIMIKGGRNHFEVPLEGDEGC